MISSRSSEGFRPLTPTDVNKCTTAGTSKNGNSVTILQTDSPRTCDLKNLRAKRLAYFVDRNHCYTNSTLAIGSLGDRQVNNNYTNGDPPRENVLNVEQNISLKEKNLDVNEPVQHTQVKNIQGMHCTDLETTLKISESAEEATCLPKPDYNFLENPTISEIEKLRHILCWAQKILKKSKEVSNTQVCQNTTVNETKLAEEHMNPDISQTTTFNRPSSTNKSTCSSPVGSRYDYTNYSADSSSGSCSSLDLLRSNRTLFQTSSPLNDVQEQYTSTNTGYSSKHHFDSNNILQRESTGQVDTYKVSGNNWTCESKILETKLPSENSDSLIDKVNALKKNDYFWIPLEGGSDDENIIENRQMKEASVDHFVKDIIPHFCDSTNQYHNNGEPILSARTVVIRTSPTTCHSSGGVLRNSVNLHNTTQHNVRSDYHYNNNNANPALSSRTVTLRRSPATNCNSLGNVLGNPVNLHYAVPHCKSTVCNQGKHNYAWEDKKVEEYSGCYEISQGDPKIAYMLRDSLSLEKDGFNLKSPFALSVIPIPCKGITESSDETTANKKGKRTNLVKGSQEIPNSDQTLKKNRNLCNANENFVSCSSISPKDCSDIILDSRGSENLPALDNYVVKKQTNCNNDEKEAKYQITESKAQHTLKLSSLPLQSSYDFNNSKISSLQFKKEESIERERDHITKEYRGSFLYTSNLVKRCPKCKSDNNSTVNWCTECGCVLIGIVPQHCDVTSNVDRCAFSNPRGSSNKEKIDILPTIATDGLKEDFEIAESNNYDFKDSEDSACFPSEMKELQLSAYQKYLLYMGHLEKIRGQHQTPEHLQTDALLEKESTNQTKSKDENQNFCGECEPEDSNIASFKLSTHFTNQTDKKHIDYEQDSEDNPILIPEMGKIPLAENVQEALELHCGIQKRNYLKQNSNVEKSKNIFHGTTLKQNFGNQNFISLKHENNKETLKVAEKKPRRKNDIQSSINQHQRCWEKSSIAGLSYTRGGIKTRSTNANHPRSDDECHGTKGKPLLLYGCSAVHMKNNKVPWKQPIKRLVNGNILDARRSKLPFENTGVTLRPTMKPREIAKYFRNNASQFCAKQICQGDDNHSPWLFLPDEIWIRVFTLLPHHDLCQVAQVCYCFYRLANDEMLWKNIKVENCSSLTDEWLKNIGNHHPQSLSFCRCNDRTNSITDSGLKELFRCSKDSLKELYVTCCSGPKLTGDSILLHASAFCHKLNSVDVRWTAATDKGIVALAQASSWLLVNGCQLTDESINALIKKHGESLRELELFGCHALSSHCLIHLAQKCLNLQILNIGRIPKLTTACLIQIVTSLKNLRTLNLSGLNAVHDSIVHHTARHCPKLDHLILSSCPQLTDVSLFEISTYLSTIRHLDVSGCKKVTDTGVQAIAMSCHKLQYIDLSSTATGKYGICLLAAYCNQNLECVKLSFCKDITEDAIKKLCKNSKQLKLLHLYGCQSVHNLKAIQDVNKQVKLHYDHPLSSVQTKC